jgi:hypothetical protein
VTFAVRFLVVAVSLSLAAPAVASDPARKCDAAKLKAVAKKTTAKLKCQAAAIAKNVGVDSECLAKAEEQFNATWARIVARGGCFRTGDASVFESKVDDYVDDVVTTLRACGSVGGTCGGECPTNESCFEIGVGCFGEPEPCRCHSSTTTCPATTSTTSETVSTSTSTTTSGSCPTYTTTTLGLPDCGGFGGTCFGGCANARECVADVNGVCGCTGALRPCGAYSFQPVCAGECAAGTTCMFYSPPLPDGCPDYPRCACVPDSP